MSRIKKDIEIKRTLVDRQHNALFTCGQCRWYMKETQRCNRAFPNTLLESTQGACMYFVMNGERRLFVNVPRK